MRRVAAPPRVGLNPLPPSPLRSGSDPASSCRLGRHLAASPPPPPPYPDPPRAQLCAPSACSRPSSLRSAHPHPPGFSTPDSTSASCACGPVVPSLRASASPDPMPSRAHSGIPRNSLPCPAALSTASPRWPPTSSHRSQSASPSPTPDPPAPPTPSRRLPDAYPDRSNAGCAKSSSGPVCLHPAQLPQSAATPASPPSARQSPAHYRCPQNIPATATGSRSPASTTAAHTGPRRNCQPALRQTRLTFPPPATH